MFITKKVILESKLEIPQILSRINEVTSSFSDKSLKTQFEGEIVENSFRILPSYDYSRNDRIRPEIKGLIINNVKLQKREIHLSFFLPAGLRLLLIVTVVVNLAIITFPQLIDRSLKEDYRLLHLIFFLVFLMIFFVTYSIRISKSIKIFKRLWNVM
jgi:hypothetical protein